MYDPSKQRAQHHQFYSTARGTGRLNRRTLSSLPGARVFLLWLILFASAILYGHLNFYRDPGSVFFNPHLAYKPGYSLWRAREADEFVESIGKDIARHDHGHGESNTISNAGKAGTHPRICASFMTVKRNIDKQYVEVSGLGIQLVELPL